MSEVQSFEPYTTMTREELLSHVQSNMSDKRYQHCLRVERKILELAKLYAVDEKAASFVGLAHDYAKEIPVDKQQALAKKSDFLKCITMKVLKFCMDRLERI